MNKKTDKTVAAGDPTASETLGDAALAVRDAGIQVDQDQAEVATAKSTALSTERAAPPAVKPTPSTEPDVFEQYGNEISQRNIVGDLLKFSKGDWLRGQEGEEVPIGTQLIVNMDELLHGWIRWEDQKPAEQRMGRLVDGFKPPKRGELGHGYPELEEGQDPIVDEDDPRIDRSEWELDDTTKAPRDPWQFSYYIVMKDPKEEDPMEGIFTFASSSSGGRGAIGDLCKVYGRKRREGYHNHYPIVALKVGSYKHSKKEYGRIKVPVFQLAGWAAKTKFGDLPPPTEMQLTQDEEIPF
jgi:hypothetical protein